MDNVKLLLLCALFIFNSLFVSSTGLYDFVPESPHINPIVSIGIKAEPLEDSSNKKQIECLAKNIYFEARNESHEGQLAVAQVTLNRLYDPKFPKELCDVVYQKTTNNKRTVCQFSWTCNEKKIHEDEAWEKSLYIAQMVLTETILHDKIAREKVLFYHAVYVNPKWKFKRITKIGNHIFYAAYSY